MSVFVTTAGSPSRADTALHSGGYLMAAAAAVALGITTWRYFTPLSGVTGTPGALLAMFGEAALLVAGIALARLARGAGRSIFMGLSWIGILLTLFATALLHGWLSVGALIVALVGLVIECLTPASLTPAPRKGGME